MEVADSGVRNCGGDAFLGANYPKFGSLRSGHSSPVGGPPPGGRVRARTSTQRQRRKRPTSPVAVRFHASSAADALLFSADRARALGSLHVRPGNVTSDIGRVKI